MRYSKAFTASGAMTLVWAACAFQACGGSEDVTKKDGGDGSTDMPDGTTVDTGTGMDSGCLGESRARSLIKNMAGSLSADVIFLI